MVAICSPTGGQAFDLAEYNSNPPAVSITIPSDCTAVYVFCAYTATATGQGFTQAGFTLSVDKTGGPDEFAEIASDGGANDYPGGCVAAFYKSDNFTASQNLEVEMAGSVSEGATALAVFVTGGDTTAWRDVGAVANQSGESTDTLTTVSGDLVLAFGFQHEYTSTPVPPGTPAGYTSIITNSITGEGIASRASYIDATTTTEGAESGATEERDVLVCVSIPDAAAGSSIPIFQNYYRQRRA
jgi:hypothetical protein